MILQYHCMGYFFFGMVLSLLVLLVILVSVVIPVDTFPLSCNLLLDDTCSWLPGNGSSFWNATSLLILVTKGCCRPFFLMALGWAHCALALFYPFHITRYLYSCPSI